MGLFGDISGAVLKKLREHIGSTDQHPVATEEAPGFMSPEDKVKIDEFGEFEEPEPVNGARTEPFAIIFDCGGADPPGSLRFLIDGGAADGSGYWFGHVINYP